MLIVSLCVPDAAKNAADLILTEPGLSPIYGAVLESRRIFARMKAYVVYRVAASIILVLCLSIVLFATGCAVDSVLVIILALLNDISMIPVAYDNAQATSRPQLPHSKKIVIMSLFYGVTQAVATLIFIFAVNNASFLTAPISLSSNCSKATRGFIWYHLVLVTELMIFSVRAPSFFLFSKPSIYLLASVFVTCVGSAFIAVDGSSLYWSDVTWIVWFNMCTLVVVDVAKIYVRRLIHDSPGEVIDSDDLLVVEPVVKTVDQLILEKQQRYEVHNESILPAEDLQRIVHIRERNNDLIHLDDFFGELYGSSITDGFISKRYEKQFILPNTNLTEIPIRKKQRSWPIW